MKGKSGNKAKLSGSKTPSKRGKIRGSKQAAIKPGGPGNISSLSAKPRRGVQSVRITPGGGGNIGPLVVGVAMIAIASLAGL
jgi:hypothetical protein